MAREPFLSDRLQAAESLLYREGFSHWYPPYAVRGAAPKHHGFALAGNGATDLRILSLVADELTMLSLRTCRVSDADLAVLASGFPVLHRVELTDLPISDEGLAPVAALPNLETLELVGTRVTDSGIALLAGHPALAVLDVSDTAVTDRGLEALAGSRTLQVLRCHRTRVTPQGVRAVAAGPAMERVEVTLPWRARRRLRRELAPIVVD